MGSSQTSFLRSHRRVVMTGIQGCQVRYEIITRARVVLEKPHEGHDEGSCLLLIIESCNVFSKAKTDRTYPVH